MLSALAMQTAIAQAPVGERDEADLPVSGRSLFAGLFADQIPFPFEALLTRLRLLAPRDALGQDGVRVVALPFSRSLQRAGTVAEAWQHPRIVAAVVGEARDASAPLLRDRLYVGFQASTATLEIISYNEAAGRFEFEVVSDYRKGGRAQLQPARRAVCLACHHDGLPIFSRPAWSETQGNPEILAGLRRAGAELPRAAMARGIDEPNAIDNAVARASLFSLVQRVWREGCTEALQAQCRAQALEAAMRYRLGGDRVIPLDADGMQAKLLQPLAEHSRLQWPQGLALPDVGLANRDPLAAPSPLSPVPALDPLLPRASTERWRGERVVDVASYVRALADFIPAADVQQFERFLAASGARNGASAGVRRVRQAPCRLQGRSATAQEWWCEAAEGWQARLSVPPAWRSGQPFRVVQLQRGVHQARELGIARDGRPQGVARFSDGAAIERIVLQKDAGGLLLGVHEVDDSQPLREALQRLMPVLAQAQVFSWSALRGAVHAAPGTVGSSASVSAAVALPSSNEPGLQAFVKRCGSCHATAQHTPPAFLRGDVASVRQRLAGCAERILYRMTMRELPETQRRKTPMPPPVAPAEAQAITPQDAAAMRAYLASLRPLSVDAVLAQAYDDLPACRPDAVRTTH